MRKKSLFVFCLFVIGVAALFYSCKKEIKQHSVAAPGSAQNMPEVRKTYEKSGFRANMKETLKDSSTIHFVADWSHATMKRISDTVAYYYIPLASFLTNKDGRLQGLKYVSVQHYLIAKETASGYTFFKASYQQAATSKDTTDQRMQENFSGVAVLDNFSKKSLYRYENGNRLSPGNSADTRWICDQECTWFSYCSGADIGSGAYTVTYTYGRSGNSCEYPWTGLPDCGFAGSTPTGWMLSGSSEFNCTYIDDGTTPPPPPGGGGGTEEPVPTFRIAEITNNFTNPCYSKVLGEINNGALTNAISKILVNLYASSDVLDIKFFNEAFSPRATEADTRMQGGSGGVIVANVTLNDSALAQNNSSKEYIGATIMHEILHAYMSYKGGTPPINEHEDMALFYLDTFIAALMDVYPGLERWQAEALAWPGLQNTYAYSEFKRNFPRIANQEAQLAAKHKTGAAGTLCP